MDSIENVEDAIKNNLTEYLQNNFTFNGMILKSGGDDIWLVKDPNSINESGKHKKIRNKLLHLTKPKKKRTKNKKTHR